jgi:hypothetical protein
MSAALPPDHAAAYVRELSADVRAVVVLGPDGALLAGPAALAAPVGAFLEATGDAPDAAERTPDGVVVAARTSTHAVVAVAGPLALDGPTAADVRTAVEALAPVPAPAPPGLVTAGSHSERQHAAKAVISATHRAI